ncbi:hypothetical protein T492DRAFT_1054081 [Pavlovales sp. CCMP2436]|nr:hypothetical protein T492DRAFT_1054081 [Pavlovales sp. CCMP2436]|mmetsp:Transcript_33202/g.82643  ORF Transcript_33202/g.82643 Transcript_33202/m.82643 type:complete len:255 (-) Transcript_33202:149-913(-)
MPGRNRSEYVNCTSWCSAPVQLPPHAPPRCNGAQLEPGRCVVPRLCQVQRRAEPRRLRVAGGNCSRPRARRARSRRTRRNSLSACSGSIPAREKRAPPSAWSAVGPCGRGACVSGAVPHHMWRCAQVQPHPRPRVARCVGGRVGPVGDGSLIAVVLAPAAVSATVVARLRLTAHQLRLLHRGWPAVRALHRARLLRVGADPLAEAALLLLSPGSGRDLHASVGFVTVATQRVRLARHLLQPQRRERQRQRRARI